MQVASCTLDASTKIYAYRVDCIHTDTMRMAGGMGMTQQHKQSDQPGGGDDQAAPTAKRRRVTRDDSTYNTARNKLSSAIIT